MPLWALLLLFQPTHFTIFAECFLQWSTSTLFCMLFLSGWKRSVQSRNAFIHKDFFKDLIDSQGSQGLRATRPAPCQGWHPSYEILPGSHRASHVQLYLTPPTQGRPGHLWTARTVEGVYLQSNLPSRAFLKINVIIYM